MGAYGKTKAEARARINSYKNPDKRCTYPFTCEVLGYCWSFAHHIDKTPGYENIEAICKGCEYWKEEKSQLITPFVSST